MLNQPIRIYLREGNGKAQVISINLFDTTQFLYSITKKLFGLQTCSFALMNNGKKLQCNSSTSVFSIIRDNLSIVHIVRQDVEQMNTKKIKIFYDKVIYEFQGEREQQFRNIKNKLMQQVGIQCKVMLFYMGRTLEDQQNLESANFRDGDIISAIIPDYQFQLDKLCLKNTESFTKSTTQKGFQRGNIFNQILRKSSMKSSQQSRQQINQRLYQDSNKAKSQSQSKADAQLNQEIYQANRLFQFSNEPWILNKKFIQTQSINCDDSFQVDDPQFWTFCFVIIKSQNLFIKIQCSQKNTWENLLDKISNTLKKQVSRNSFSLQSKDLIAEMQITPTVLDVAKNRVSQTLPQLVLVQ